MLMRGQARKEVQRLGTEDGNDWKLAVDVRKKTEAVVKKPARGRKKTRKADTEDMESSESGGGDLCVETSKGAGLDID